mgnify:CR=1 FL=1
MIDRVLMELYDEYEKGNMESIIEFTNKTFPNDGTGKLFIGCLLILFSNDVGAYKPRYFATRERLYSIVLAAKEKIGNTNLLAFYIDRINRSKGISKYLADIVKDKNIDKYADLIIEYLDQFKPNFVSNIKKNYSDKIEEYIKNNEQKN